MIYSGTLKYLISTLTVNKGAHSSKYREKMKIGIILGSVRPGRMGDRVGQLVAGELERRKHKICVFDPAEYKMGLLEKPLHFYGPSEDKPRELVDLHTKLCQQDAFVFVTPEYNFRFVYH